MPEFSKAGRDEHELLRGVIGKYKPELANVVSFELAFRSDKENGWKSKGREVYAKIDKVPPKWKPYLSADYLIVVNREQWEQHPELKWRRALLHHEACHLRVDPDTEEIEMVGHDLEEFREIVREHGAWDKDVELFAAVVRQLKLPGVE